MKTLRDVRAQADEIARSGIWALAILLITTGLMFFLSHYPFQTSPVGGAPLALGYLILSGWCCGLVAQKLGLPKLSGYILAGIAAGPQVLNYVSSELVEELHLVDDLALTFIALVAGGELHFGLIRQRWRSILSWVTGQILITPLIVGTGIFVAARWIPGASDSTASALALAIVLSALALARSPAATIVVIEESNARGPFTETTLATTVSLDTLVILLFAVAVAIAEKLLSPGAAVDLKVLAFLSADLALSILLGAVIAAVVTFLIRSFDIDLPVLLAGVAFLITRASRELSELLGNHDVHLHLEPLLMGLTAGVLVQNLSKRGHLFAEALERVGPPIYVAFFALTGAALDIRVLKETWIFALFLVVLRAAGLYAGSWVGSALGKDPAHWRRLVGWTSIAQAGVSLGLAAEIARRFPQWGSSIVAPVIAAIAVNQIVGPILLARSLAGAGEISPDEISEEQGDTL